MPNTSVQCYLRSMECEMRKTYSILPANITTEDTATYLSLWRCHELDSQGLTYDVVRRVTSLIVLQSKSHSC